MIFSSGNLIETIHKLKFILIAIEIFSIYSTTEEYKRKIHLKVFLTEFYEE